MLAFSTSAVCFSWMLPQHGSVVESTIATEIARGVGAASELARDAGSRVGGDGPALGSFLVAFLSCLLFFLQLRIADEFKDLAEDSRWRPYRPVPRGLVTLRELGVVFVLASVVQLGLALWLQPRLVVLLLLTWLYLAGMSKEFFVAHWLRGKHLLYMVTHMAIMPLIDLYATSAEWMVSLGRPPKGLLWFLLASLFNGMVIEIGRKIRREKDEEEGVSTYSVVWGRPRAVAAWWLVLVLTFVCACLAAARIDFLSYLAPLLGVVLAVAAAAGIRFLRSTGDQRTSGTVFERLAAAWTLALYLGLGLIPYFVLHVRHGQ